MFRTQTLLILILALSLAGCSAVSTPHLLGEAIDDSTAERFNGVWKSGDALFLTRHLGEGKFRIATSRWNESEQQFEFEQGSLHVRALGEALLLHLLEDESDEAEQENVQYSLARVLHAETGEIIFIPADAKRFAAAVRSGELKGEASGPGSEAAPEGFSEGNATNVRLTGTKEEIDAYLTVDRLPLLFNVKDCAVLRRVEGVEID